MDKETCEPTVDDRLTSEVEELERLAKIPKWQQMARRGAEGLIRQINEVIAQRQSTAQCLPLMRLNQRLRLFRHTIGGSAKSQVGHNLESAARLPV